MDYRRRNNNIMLRLDKGDDIVESILDVAKKENITLAEINGLGATDDFQIGVFNLETKEYDLHDFSGNHEITNLCGSITMMDDEQYHHLHITCANSNGDCVGGHLYKAKISLTCEIFIRIIDSRLDRIFDENIGINRWDFKSEQN